MGDSFDTPVIPGPDETVSVYPRFNLTELLIATWFNLSVYTFEMTLGIYYLNCLTSARRFNRRVVGVILCLETVCTVAVCIHGYDHFFVYDSPADSITSWNIPIIVICTTLSTMAEQLYFTHRFWRISYKRVMAITIAVVIITRAVFVLIFVLYSRITLYKDLNFGSRTMIIAAALSVTIDMLIAALSFWKIKRIRTVYDTTKNFLKKMSVYAITCGIVSSLATIITVVITFVSLNLFNIVFYALGRIYTLTVLLNLMIHRGFVNQAQASREGGPESRPQELGIGDIDLSNLPLPRASLIVSGGQITTTCDDYIDENGHYKKPPPAPSFSMDAI